MGNTVSEPESEPMLHRHENTMEQLRQILLIYFAKEEKQLLMIYLN
jgi:hypothetical protein